MPESHGEILARLEEKFESLEKNLTVFMQRADNGGWRRCVERAAEMRALKKLYDDLAKEFDTIKKKRAEFDLWLMRLTWTAVICGVVKMAFF